MAPNQIDISDGLVPATPPTSITPSVDISDGLVPMTPAPQTSSPSPALTSAVTGPGTFLGTSAGPTDTWSSLLSNPVAFAKRVPEMAKELISKPLVKPENAISDETKQAHPIATGAAEFAGGLTTPTNLSVMGITGGLGSLPGTAGKIVPRLVSAGFSGQMLESAFKEIPGFRAALADGNAAEAERILTHMTLDLAATALGSQHAITGAVPKPLFPGMDEAVKDYVNKGAQKVVENGKVVAGKMAQTASDLSNGAKATVTRAVGKEVPADRALNAAKDFKAAVPPTATAPYKDTDYQTARNYLEEHHADIQPIRSVEDLRDASDHSIKSIENNVSDLIKVVPDEPISTNVLSDVTKALSGNPRGQEYVDSGLKELEGLQLDNVTLSKADAIRRQLNLENQGILKKNNYDLETARASNPGFAAREAAAESLRNGIYDQLENYGIKGVRDMRLDEGSLIKIRNAAQHQIFKGEKTVRGTGKSGPAREIAKNTIKMATTAGGAAIAGPAGAVVGSTVGEGLGKLITPGDLTRDQLIENSFNRKVAVGEPTKATINLQQPSTQPVSAGTQGELLTDPSTLFDLGQSPAEPRPGPITRIEGRNYDATDLGKQAPGGPNTTPPPIELKPSEGAAPLARVEGKPYQGNVKPEITPPLGYSAEKDVAGALPDTPSSYARLIPANASPAVEKAVTDAGGTYHGKNSQGLVEITLPRSMTNNLPIDDRFKNFVSITLPEKGLTADTVRKEMYRKFKEMGGKDE